ncbi:unnamed protein product [Brassica oleracea]
MRVGARGLWPSRESIVSGLKGGRLCCFGGRSQGFLTFCSSLRGPYSVVSVAAAPISVRRFSAKTGVWWPSCLWPPHSTLGLRSHPSITEVCLSSCGGVA